MAINRNTAVSYWRLPLLIALMLSACSGGGGSSGPSPPPPPSAFSYPVAPAFTVGTAITALTPTVTGSVTAYSVSPELPAGLTLSGTTGVISGTPTAITAKATYAITASNASGMAMTTISLVVNDLAPIATYGALAYSYTAGLAANAVTPTVSAKGGKVVSWSVSPSLPAGLALSGTDGTISGTPGQAAPMTTYAVTATNTGGTINLPLSIAVAAGPLLNLGHSSEITFMRLSGTRVLSLDALGHWALQDFASGSTVVTGEEKCNTTTPVCFVDVEGPTVVAATPAGFNTFSSATGVTLASATATATWYALASDGSYVATGNTSGLTAWSPTTGQMLFTRAGNYATAAVYAKPGTVEVANGAAGANVIETLSVPGGGSTVTPPFQGRFNAWFIDGTSFLTSLGTTVWVYSNAAVLEDILTVASLNTLGGEGHWFWTLDSSSYVVNVYAVGTGNNPPPAYSYHLGAGIVIGSGTTVGLLGGAGVTVVDLSGATPVGTTYATPINNGTAYAAASASSWLVGDNFGVVLDGSQFPAQSRFLTYGDAFSIAGGTNEFAIATASGRILYFDSATNSQLGMIPLWSDRLSSSTDGSVLAAAAITYASPTDRSVRIYSLPVGTLINKIPYAVGVTPFPISMTMSGSGTVLAEMLAAPTTCHAQLIPTTGGSPIWCDTTGQFSQLALSPDGTLLAASTGSNANLSLPNSTANIYKNGTLVTSVVGWAPGWMDNGHLLVNSYVFPTCTGCQGGVYSGATIYDSAGTKLSTLSSPELIDLQPVSATSVYSPSLNELVSTANGAVLWASGNPFFVRQGMDVSTFAGVGVGAIAGFQVVFVSGSLVLTQPY